MNFRKGSSSITRQTNESVFVRQPVSYCRRSGGPSFESFARLSPNRHHAKQFCPVYDISNESRLDLGGEGNCPSIQPTYPNHLQPSTEYSNMYPPRMEYPSYIQRPFSGAYSPGMQSGQPFHSFRPAFHQNYGQGAQLTTRSFEKKTSKLCSTNATRSMSNEPGSTLAQKRLRIWSSEYSIGDYSREIKCGRPKLFKAVLRQDGIPSAKNYFRQA